MIEYGIRTPDSNTVLIVTCDRSDAENALAWIPGGRIVRRTITYSDWLPDSDLDSPPAALFFNAPRHPDRLG